MEKAVVLKEEENIKFLKDPRQQLFLAYFLDPKSQTFANALQSGLRAGFARNYAESILSFMPSWLMEKLGKSSLLLKAERNLQEFLDLPNETQAIGVYGPVFEKKKIQDGFFKNGKPKFKTIKTPVMRLDPKVMKIKQDTSHFVAETLGKARFSKKEGPAPIQNNVFIFANEQRAKIAKRIIRGGSISNTPSEGESD